MKPCAHVICKTCTESLVRPAKQCVICDTKLGEKDVLELKREGAHVIPGLTLPMFATYRVGTGFAGGGLAETSKKSIAFQG
jgi:nitric oxide synthase-interacting protein